MIITRHNELGYMSDIMRTQKWVCPGGVPPPVQSLTYILPCVMSDADVN